MFQPKEFSSINGVAGLSERQMKEHYKLYEGYVKKANEITDALKSADLTKANATYSDLRALKLGYSFAVNAIKSHELYFGNLSGNGAAPTGAVGKMIADQFGSYDAWLADLKATGLAARGWVWLATTPEGYLFNFLGDAQNTYPLWGAAPILALDTYEHAYWLDTANRGEYIDNFFDAIDWDDVAMRYEKKSTAQ